jgi:MFS family permease
MEIMPTAAAAPDSNAVYRKIAIRLMPFLLCCYVINYLDRVSIGYAKLQFIPELHLNEAVFGLITSAFFIGYILFEIPSNLLLLRIGAPKTLMRIMTLWGLAIVSMAWARNEYWFYVQRFLLGAFEAGFFPGVLLYLSFWFPNHQRGRATSLFLVGIPLSGVLGGVISGGVMEGMDGLLGLRGWRWLFLVDGLPAVFLGLAAWFVLTDRPEHARFLSPAEKQLVVQDMAADRIAHSHPPAGSIMEVLRSAKVWSMVFVYFTMAFLNTNQIWFPTLLRNSGAGSVTEAAWILAGVWVLVAAFVLLVSRSSDRILERKWHILGTGLMAAGGYLALALAAGNLWATAFLVTLSAAGGYAVFTVFWTIPPVWLAGRGAAMGIALISALGQFGGLSGPAVVGWVFQDTGSLYIGLAIAAVLLVAGTAVAVFVIPHARLRRPGEMSGEISGEQPPLPELPAQHPAGR